MSLYIPFSLSLSPPISLVHRRVMTFAQWMGWDGGADESAAGWRRYDMTPCRPGVFLVIDASGRKMGASTAAAQSHKFRRRRIINEHRARTHTTKGKHTHARARDLGFDRFNCGCCGTNILGSSYIVWSSKITSQCWDRLRTREKTKLKLGSLKSNH